MKNEKWTMTNGKSSLLRNNINLTVKRVPPVVVQLSNITIEQQVPVFLQTRNTRGVLSTFRSLIRERTHERD